MNKELQTVLNWVWENRNDIIGRANIVPATSYSYNTDPFTNGAVLHINEYLGAMEFVAADEEQQPEDNRAAHAKYLDSLWVIATNLGCRELELSYISSNRALHKTMKVRSSTIDRLKRANHRGAYFTYRKMPGVADGQIYINLAQRGRIPALLELLDDVWNVDGFLCAKVVGPWNDRVDTVVIEFKGAGVQRNLIDVIKTFAARNPQYMRNRRRKLTMPVPNLAGVSLGREPPDAAVRRTNNGYDFKHAAQSYGIYRAQLIFMALERTVRPTAETVKQRWFNGKTFRRFKGRVETYFDRAGLSTSKPWRQGDGPAHVLKNQSMFRDMSRIVENKKYVKNYSQQQRDLAEKKRKDNMPVHKLHQPVWPHGGDMKVGTKTKQQEVSGIHGNLHRGGLI